jgi:hypothetical protein
VLVVYIVAHNTWNRPTSGWNMPNAMAPFENERSRFVS